MKKQLPAFLSGVVVTALIFTCAPAIAAQFQTIAATLNSVNIEVNGAKVSSVGEDYTLENGKQTAGSIVFNDTTYVPIRKFGEVMGANIGYDAATGSVTVKGEVAVPETNPAPETPIPADYSDWTAEEEKAYQEFLAKFVITASKNPDTSVDAHSYSFVYGGDEAKHSLLVKEVGSEQYKNFARRYLDEQMSALVFTDQNSFQAHIFFYYQNSHEDSTSSIVQFARISYNAFGYQMFGAFLD